MRFAIHTLGCKVNQYETQAMETILTQRGHTLVPSDGAADVYIINTCSVTAISDKKCRNVIRRTRRDHPEAVVAVCGCYAQAKPHDITALGVDLVAGTGDRVAFLDQLEQYSLQPAEGLAAAEPSVSVDDALGRHDFEVLPAGSLTGRTRAMLKVEDGCGNFCTYCIIPFTRGPVRSESIPAAVAQASALAEAGYREIVLTGIEISSWGQDLEGSETLIDLMEAICRTVPQLRIRLGSLEPRTITADFCRRAAQLDNLCPHFHLALQSGCNATLQRMNRKYTTERFLESCRLLREQFDRPAITTDLICGFAGETEDEFAATLALIQKADFSAMHIFPYSRRSSTVADRQPGQLPNEVKETRCHAATQIAREMEQRYLERWVGEPLPVLFEEMADGCWRGHAPNYVEVLVPAAQSTDNLHNVIKSVQITGLRNRSLEGILL